MACTYFGYTYCYLIAECYDEVEDTCLAPYTNIQECTTTADYEF